VWFTEFGKAANKIARITPAGVVNEFAVPTASSAPEWITAGPDGDLWFSEAEVSKIGRITPSGAIEEFDLPTAKSVPTGIAPGADGSLWFSEYETGRIGRIGSGAPGALASAPALTGGGQQGTVQTCDTTWSTWASLQPLPTLLGFDGYSWLLDGVRVASGQTYTPTVANIGHELACSVTATYPLPLFVTAVATSSPIVVTAPPTPVITRLRESAKRWRDGRALARIDRRPGARRPPVGTTFSFRLNVQASVAFTFTGPHEGRRIGHTCLTTTRRNAHRRRCVHSVVVGSLSFPGHARINTVAFQRRLTVSHPLAPGRYAVLIVATNTVGVRSVPSSLHFTITSTLS
jgi:hypothetical protein